MSEQTAGPACRKVATILCVSAIAALVFFGLGATADSKTFGEYELVFGGTRVRRPGHRGAGFERRQGGLRLSRRPASIASDHFRATADTEEVVQQALLAALAGRAHARERSQRNGVTGLANLMIAVTDTAKGGMVSR